MKFIWAYAKGVFVIISANKRNFPRIFRSGSSWKSSTTCKVPTANFESSKKILVLIFFTRRLLRRTKMCENYEKLMCGKIIFHVFKHRFQTFTCMIKARSGFSSALHCDLWLQNKNTKLLSFCTQITNVIWFRRCGGKFCCCCCIFVCGKRRVESVRETWEVLCQGHRLTLHLKPSTLEIAWWWLRVEGRSGKL